MDYYVSAGNKLFNPDAESSFSFLKQPCRKTHGKDVHLFQKGQIIGMHQAKKTFKEIAEATKIDLRTVQRIIKNWKDSGEPSSTILNDRDRRSLKHLVIIKS